MSVEFHEPGPVLRKRPVQKKTGAVVRLILKTGIAKDEQQANFVMLGLIVLLCLIMFFAIRSTNDSASTADEPAVEIGADGAPLP